eukprot:scaffold6933_cov19-Tisochrysis_lutea.AAC.3
MSRSVCEYSAWVAEQVGLAVILGMKPSCLVKCDFKPESEVLGCSVQTGATAVQAAGIEALCGVHLAGVSHWAAGRAGHFIPGPACQGWVRCWGGGVGAGSVIWLGLVGIVQEGGGDQGNTGQKGGEVQAFKFSVEQKVA